MRIKKIICAVVSGAMLFSACAPVSAWDREYGTEEYEGSATAVSEDAEILREKEDPNDDSSLLYTVRADGTAMITGYAGKFMEGASYKFDIPSEINGHTVAAIGNDALRDGFGKIIGIKLPKTVKEIGSRAIDCRYLEYLELNDGLEVIKDYGIMNCGEKLTSLKIPDSVKYIGSEAIGGEALTEIILPKNLEYLGKNILFGTAYVNEPSNRENNILYCGPYLLAGLRIGYADIDNADPSAPTENRQIREWEATGDIEIREGTTLMCEDSFGMSGITSVKIPSTLKAIPYLGFYWCQNLDNVVIPGNVKEIGDNAFSWCENLTNLTISEGVEKIGDMAFFRCNKLNEVTIPKSVTEIGLQAFGWDYADGSDVRNENFVIRAYSGSAAEQYAKDNGFRCILIDTGSEISAGKPTAAADSRQPCEEKGENCAVRRFIDLASAEGDPNHSAVEYCLDKGIMAGTGDDTFTPDGTITRGQFAAMFYRLAGEPEASETCKFTDLTQDWYKKAVNWACANGVISGMSDTEFCPDLTINREQIAAIFYRYAQSRGIDVTLGDNRYLDYSSCIDSTDISGWAYDAVDWCFAKSVMFEYNDGGEYIIGAKKAPTRAETATLFSKFDYLINNG